MVVPGIAAKRAEGASKALTGDIYTRRWVSVTGKGKKRKEVEHEVRVNAVTGAVAVVGAAAAAVGLGAALWFTQQKLHRGDTERLLIRRVRAYDAIWGKVPYEISPATSTTTQVSDYFPEKGHWETIAGAITGYRCKKDAAFVPVIWPVGKENVGTPTNEQQIATWMALHGAHGFEQVASTTSQQRWVVDEAAHWGPLHDQTTTQAAVMGERDGIIKASRTIIGTKRGVPVKVLTGLERLPTDREVVGANWQRFARTNEPWPVVEGEDRLGKYSEYWATYKTTKKGFSIEDRDGFSIGGGLFG